MDNNRKFLMLACPRTPFRSALSLGLSKNSPQMIKCDT